MIANKSNTIFFGEFLSGELLSGEVLSDEFMSGESSKKVVLARGGLVTWEYRLTDMKRLGLNTSTFNGLLIISLEYVRVSCSSFYINQS